MDLQTGTLYESVDKAVDAGVPRERLVRVRETAAVQADPYRCEQCEKRVKPRRSTPHRESSDGLIRWWCKACWKKLGRYGGGKA